MSMHVEGTQVAKPPPVFRTAFLSMLLWWLSFPPVGIGLLAWFAPVPLVLLCLGEKFSGRRPYLKLYLAGLVYWLATFYFIPIPHPALWGGWVAVSAYMAFYTPLLVAVSRVSIHRFRVPPVIVLPIVGTGIEYIRCHFATGMPMVCLSHSQYDMPVVIQIADLSGAYTVTALIWIVAASIAIGIVYWGPIGKWKLASETTPQGWPGIYRCRSCVARREPGLRKLAVRARLSHCGKVFVREFGPDIRRCCFWPVVGTGIRTALAPIG